MMKKMIMFSFFGAFLLAACASPAQPVATPAPTIETAPAAAAYSDPYSYCAAVGTIDAPDARYSGEAVPDDVIKGYIQAIGAEDPGNYDEFYRDRTIWRCMDSKVYACNFGANLPCSSKANTDSNPTQAILDYCKEQPDSEFIPMVVTGHETIYSWHCVGDAPEILEQIGQADAAGYLSNIWYEVAQP